MRIPSGKPTLWLLSALILGLIGVSCSTRKNNAATRNYQAFITRYNIYYNGDRHYIETLQDMEEKYEDDYTSLVLMHPVEAKNDPQAPQPTGNFDRSIEKGQKAVQLRSIKKRPARKGGKLSDAQKAWLKREEYNPFLHNAWLMMGRGQYFNGDFLGAASTFFYVSKHFWWLPATVTEAEIWQARSYVSMDWLFEAEVILKRIKPESLTDKNLRGLYAFTQADYLIHSEKYAEAIQPLKEAIAAASGPQKTRLRFLLGQLYTRTGQRQLAYDAFKAAGSSPSASYRTKFNARIKQSEVYDGSDIEPEVKALRRMVRYDRNKDYLDQIYYAIGNLYLSRRDTTRAIENYVLAAEKSTRNGIEKAISQLTLGGLYFDRREYEKAQPCYAEAVPLLPKDYPDIKKLQLRSDVLDELATYAQNVNLQDSLLRLAAMSPEQRMKVIEKIIEDLKKKEKEEAEAAAREEFLANAAAQGNQLQDNNTNSFTINSDNSWYFYNTATKNAGKAEFQRRWGARKLEDNWRRRNKSQFNTDDWASPSDSEEQETESTDSVAEKPSEEAEHATDPHFPEYYLAQIPETEEQKNTAHEIIQEGLYNMGVILKDKLEDFPAARAEFDRLLKDYPDNVYRLEVYYNLYLMYARMNDLTLAEHYRRLILEEFPDSPYGIAMKDPNYLENLRRMDQRQQELYDDTYDAYINNRNSRVHANYEEMQRDFPLSKIMPKFMFLDALAYVTERQPEKFNETLKSLLERYPDTDITPIASAWLKGMAQGRELMAGTGEGGNLRGMIWDMRLGNDSTAVAEGEAAFTLSPDDRQLLVMTFDAAEVPVNALLYELARHNFRSFQVKDFDLEPINFGRLGMIVIRDFENLDELNYYHRTLLDSPDFKLPRGVRPVIISDKNFKILMDEHRSFDEYFNFLQQSATDLHDLWWGEETIAPGEPEEPEEAAEADLPENAEETEASATRAESVDQVTVIETEVESDPAEDIETVETVEFSVAPGESVDNTSQDIPVKSETPEVPTPTVSPEPVRAAEKTAAKPEPTVIVPVPVPSTLPSRLPAYAPGSEGDDPLFD
ncbi:MAG: tetratricopeptide repeat protein [Muribaculaceae bacterium]|nr:tetratricopeptide repeat protein [Muribaculaceae bacterium]